MRDAEQSSGDDLLAQGIARFIKGATWEAAPSGYARITIALGTPRLPDELPEALAAAAAGGRSPARRDLAGLVLVDIESLGFIGRPLFLIGALYARAGKAQVVQYLARDYSEEETVLRAFGEDVAGAGLWISYNGRSFDLPFLELRRTHHRLPPLAPERHLDLLPIARRLWRDRLPDCKLKTIERLITRRPRPDGDIAGGQIPAAYHAFVRTGEPLEMIDVLRHNASDLTSLLDIFQAAVTRQGEIDAGVRHTEQAR